MCPRGSTSSADGSALAGCAAAPPPVDVPAARAALARLRLLRALRWHLRGREALAGLGAAAPALAMLGGFALVLAHGGPRGASDEPLAIALIVLAMMGALALVIAAMPLGATAAMTAAMHVLIAPYHAVRAVRALRRRRWRREAEGLLDRDGCVPVAWTRGEDGRAEVLKDLLRARVGLTYEAEALRAEPWPAGHRCARCGAEARPVGEGVWRCGHCAREAFAALPAAPEVAAARAALVAVAEGDAPPRTRRELWRAFRERHGGAYRDSRRAMLVVGAGYLGAALVSQIGWWLRARWLWGPPLLGIVLLGLPLCYLLCRTAYDWAHLRFVQFGPGQAAYERALLDDALTTIAQQGRIGGARLAAHLGISRDHLATVLAQLERLGGAPVLHDRERDELISLAATEIGARACPACGGELRPGPRATITCAHCGAALRAGGGHRALHAA